ncbi:MAG TPA: hypothetical protein VK456_10980 [Xanthobacteraceae bacterium]|nr:hypothetical protein [Xanthobacteraceae bacterium]
MILVNLGIVAVVLGVIWHFSEPDRKFPGFAAYTVLRIFPVPDFRRQYVFDFGSQQGARASFYLSASDKFTFVITDIRGESYPLEINITKIPVDRFIMLSCEVGIEHDYTLLRVRVNGRDVEHRRLSFPIDLGDRKWGPGTTIGANGIGANNGAFMLVELGASDSTFSRSEIDKLFDNVRTAFDIRTK